MLKKYINLKIVSTIFVHTLVQSLEESMDEWMKRQQPDISKGALKSASIVTAFGMLIMVGICSYSYARLTDPNRSHSFSFGKQRASKQPVHPTYSYSFRSQEGKQSDQYPGYSYTPPPKSGYSERKKKHFKSHNGYADYSGYTSGPQSGYPGGNSRTQGNFKSHKGYADYSGYTAGPRSEYPEGNSRTQGNFKSGKGYADYSGYTSGPQSGPTGSSSDSLSAEAVDKERRNREGLAQAVENIRKIDACAKEIKMTKDCYNTWYLLLGSKDKKILSKLNFYKNFTDHEPLLFSEANGGMPNKTISSKIIDADLRDYCRFLRVLLTWASLRSHDNVNKDICSAAKKSDKNIKSLDEFGSFILAIQNITKLDENKLSFLSVKQLSLSDLPKFDLDASEKTAVLSKAKDEAIQALTEKLKDYFTSIKEDWLGAWIAKDKRITIAQFDDIQQCDFEKNKTNPFKTFFALFKNSDNTYVKDSEERIKSIEEFYEGLVALRSANDEEYKTKIEGFVTKFTKTSIQ